MRLDFLSANNICESNKTGERNKRVSHDEKEGEKKFSSTDAQRQFASLN